MGQRSQIYVRYPLKDNRKGLLANYYQWNYGDRMVSRARYGIEWILETLPYLAFYYTIVSNVTKLSRILDVNFDYKDVQISLDIIKERNEILPDKDFKEAVFYFQNNNDGKLFIDITANGIRYAFTDGDINHIMNAAQYMEWDMSSEWKDKLQEAEVLTCTNNNIKYITENARLMTRAELDDFINYDYEAPKF